MSRASRRASARTVIARAAGARTAPAFVTWIGFLSPQVTVESGGEDLAVYESSPDTKRSFCRVCGTKLFFESAKWPGETHIALAAFDDPVDRAPEGDAFYDEHVAWIERRPDAAP